MKLLVSRATGFCGKGAKSFEHSMLLDLRIGLVVVIVCCLFLGGCKRPQQTVKNLPTMERAPSVRVALSEYGLPADYAKLDDVDCSSNIIGYRFIVWLTKDLVSVGFNVSPTCRAKAEVALGPGILRLLVFDTGGAVAARRDIAYDADAGQELVAPGEAMSGPGGTLLVRIEEAGASKSGVRLFDEHLLDAGRIDRFMETGSVLEQAMAFQEGFVSSGPRTYDVYDGYPVKQVGTITEDWPAGTMDRRVSRDGVVYALCTQELSPDQYRSSNVIYSGANRRCEIEVKAVSGAAWKTPLGQNRVAEIVGMLGSGDVVGIVRGSKSADQLVVWSQNRARSTLPWFPVGYDTKLLGARADMSRYAGYGVDERPVGEPCSLVGVACDRKPADARLMIFDRSSEVPLVDRMLSEHGRAAISPDGLHYATFESGELRIYPLPSSVGVAH